jgi:hypothetical protein
MVMLKINHQLSCGFTFLRNVFLTSLFAVMFSACQGKKTDFDPYNVNVSFDSSRLADCLKKEDQCLIVLSVATKNVP